MDEGLCWGVAELPKEDCLHVDLTLFLVPSFDLCDGRLVTNLPAYFEDLKYDLVLPKLSDDAGLLLFRA